MSGSNPDYRCLFFFKTFVSLPLGQENRGLTVRLLTLSLLRFCLTSPNRARARFATEASDLLTDVKAYDECARLRADGKPGAIRAFCEDVGHLVSFKRQMF